MELEKLAFTIANIKNVAIMTNRPTRADRTGEPTNNNYMIDEDVREAIGRRDFKSVGTHLGYDVYESNLGGDSYKFFTFVEDKIPLGTIFLSSYVNILPNSHTVVNIMVRDEARGTRLGQAMYDFVIRRGTIISDISQTEHSKRAWYNLYKSNKYNIRAYDPREKKFYPVKSTLFGKLLKVPGADLYDNKDDRNLRLVAEMK